MWVWAHSPKEEAGSDLVSWEKFKALAAKKPRQPEKQAFTPIGRHFSEVLWICFHAQIDSTLGRMMYCPLHSNARRESASIEQAQALLQAVRTLQSV